MKYCSYCKFLLPQILGQYNHNNITYRYYDRDLIYYNDRICMCSPIYSDDNNWEFECIDRVITAHDPSVLNAKNDCEYYKEKWIYRILAWCLRKRFWFE